MRLLLSVACCFLSVVLFAQDNNPVIHLWNNGAPGFESKKDLPEEKQEWWVRNIHNPSVTVFKAPANIATGAAVVVCPGGGFMNLVYDAEGRDAAQYLNSLGITAFVLKYRLFRRDSTLYTIENMRQDIFRAMRLVRARAKEFDVDTARIGVMGFSAGGEVAGAVGYHFNESHALKHDDIDALSARPAFQILIYPGPLTVPDRVSPQTPPTFLLVANDDPCCSEPVIKLLQMHREAKVPVEAHIYAMGTHGFNMGKRSEYKSLKTWPDRLTDWINDTKVATRK